MNRGAMLLLPALAGLLSGCAAMPSAVVAVPKNGQKPLYQIDRLYRAPGNTVRWAFANDLDKATTLQFEFDPGTQNVFESTFELVCVQVNEKTLKSDKQKSKPRSTGNGLSFPLTAATSAGPSVCVASLQIRKDASSGEHHYRILQDGVEKQDPVIIIR
jgi:hypothetical protein